MIFKDIFNTKSAGLYNKIPINVSQVGWADTIIVMEEEQRDEIANRFPKEYLKKRILNLDIPDIFHFYNPKLINILKLKMNEFAFLF